MSRLFPHTPYAEDQPLPTTILTTHVLTRGLTTGSLLGTLVFSARQFVAPRLFPTSSSTLSYNNPAATLLHPRPALHNLLRTTGTSALATMAFVSLGLATRMRGREGIEWRDRSWRLLENKGQMEVDDFTAAGVVGALGMGAALKGRDGRRVLRSVGWTGIVGLAGLGSLVGTVGYLAWRYGVRGGRFEEE